MPSEKGKKPGKKARDALDIAVTIVHGIRKEATEAVRVVVAISQETVRLLNEVRENEQDGKDSRPMDKASHHTDQQRCSLYVVCAVKTTDICFCDYA